MFLSKTDEQAILHRHTVIKENTCTDIQLAYPSAKHQKMKVKTDISILSPAQTTGIHPASKRGGTHSVVI